jgi:seryl-tRNA synthetase
MIDLSLLREEPAKIKKLINKKDPAFDVDVLIAAYKKVRELKTSIEELRKERNSISKKASGGVDKDLREKSIEIGQKIKSQQKEFEEQEKILNQLWLTCPNIPFEDIPSGNKEKNKVIKTVGKKPEFDFEVKNHLQLNEKLGWFDFEAGAKIAGSQFLCYRKDAVKILYALTQMMLKNNVKHGFEPVLPPYLATKKSLTNSGNLPKFAEDVYSVPADDLYLIPTAEVSLTNINANEILATDKLPIRYCAWTGCFRREAGGYGAQERGLIRIHEFEKVELYTLTKPEASEKEQDKMIACAEDILQQLGLHYQISLLAAQDCSFCSAKTYDIEVWLPGQKKYFEVSSASNCTDFQARRAAIRYREDADAKPKLVHTLNASSLALPRLMVAIVETYQKEDGSVELPKKLQDFCDNWW